jgi:hypothetical protein
MSTIKTMKERLLPVILLVAGIMAVSFSTAFSQTFSNIGENVDLWRVRGDTMALLPPILRQPALAVKEGTTEGFPPWGDVTNGGPWHADSLWLGSTFQRDITKSFIVWLAPYFHAGGTYRGSLYIMIPRPGLPDSALFLFHNRCNGTAPTRIDLTNITPTIQNLDTVFFMYRSDSGNGGLGNCGGWFGIPNDYGVKQTDSLFTGPNRAPIDTVVPVWVNFDRHWSGRNENTLHTLLGNAPFIPDTFWSLSKNKYVKYGRRWCEAGWIHKDTLPKPGSNVRTDTVEFGFEDQFNGQDQCFEDIRFELTGVFLNYPMQIDSLVLHLFPNKDTLHSYTKVDTVAAGDSLFLRAVIWGKDTTPAQNIFVDSTDLAKKVTWQLMKSTQSTSFMSLGAGPSNNNTFKATTAYEWDTIVVTYLNVRKRKPIYVKPGSDYKVWIEPDSSIDPRGTSAAMITRLHTQDSVASVTITSLENQKSVYAVVRDQFGNFTRFANNSVWTEVKNAGVTISIANPVNGTPAFVGLINRVNAGLTNVQVSAKNLASGANLVSSMVKVIVDAIPLNNLINDQTFSVAERSVAGTPVGNVVIAVPASVNVTLTQLTTVPEFAFNLTTRNITVAAGAVLSYKTKNSFSFKLIAKAPNAYDDTATITIQLIELTPIANLLNDQVFSVKERSLAGTAMGTVVKAVPDSILVTLTPIGIPAEFAFNPATRAITVASGAVLNYNTKSSYSFRLAAEATNAYALNDTATITIQLIQLIPIANLLNDQAFSVKEKSLAGTSVGTVVKVVPDSILVTLTPIGLPAEFAFDAFARTITVAQPTLNYDTKSSYSFRLAAAATTAYALPDTATITIQLVADSLIPATATLLDTNHNGHIDMINIIWTDPSPMKSVLPSVAQLIRTLSLMTLDKQNDSLHAAALVLDTAKKTVHIVISENSQTLETGWDTAKISLNPIPVSVKGGYFLVTKTLDSAAPILTAVCYLPGSTQDSLVATFSEPLDQSGTAGYLQTLMVNTKTGQKTLSSLNATLSGAINNKLNFLVPAGVVSAYENSIYLSFASGPASPTVEINYCHPLPLIVTGKAGPNPFTPGVNTPPGRHGDDPLYGIRIEILLNSANTSIAGGENRPATCTIFDAVGNVILQDATLKPDPVAARKKYFIWDGKNRNGMTVAGGTYLARVIVEDKKTGSKVMTPIKIGVKTVK